MTLRENCLIGEIALITNDIEDGRRTSIISGLPFNFLFK